MGKEEEKEEDVEAKIAKYEAYLNDTLRGDLRLCLEERDKLYTEQADLLGKAAATILNEAFPLKICIYSQIYQLVVTYYYLLRQICMCHCLLLTDWFARKNLRRHSDIYNVYYY